MRNLHCGPVFLQDNLRDAEQHFKVLHQATSSTQGKMNLCFCVVLIILFCLSSRYSSVEIRLELQKNILKFDYGINYKYEGMLPTLLIDFMWLQNLFCQL